MTIRTLLYTAAASTFVAGLLHLAIVPMFFSQMSLDVTIFFIVVGMAQLFWVIPTVKRWIMPWYYIGIGGTVILIIMYFIPVPGSGYPISPLDVAVEISQIAFVILSIIIIKKNRAEIKSGNIYR